MPRKKAKHAYHHGDLPRTLLRVAGDILGEVGVAGFSLREASRRAGVTIGASVHHFGSSRGLLTAVAAGAFERLCEIFDAAAKRPESPSERLFAALEGYVLLSRTNPGPFSVMFRWDLLDQDDAKFAELAPRAHALFTEHVRQAALSYQSDEKVGLAADSLWAAIHGLVDLGLLEKGSAQEDSRALGPDARRRLSFLVETFVGGALNKPGDAP
ncbi:MAG: TetR/AcrR family transcriptional regulator [Myxococcota bacterium]